MIKIPKPYWIVGSLVTAGIVTVAGYNIIVASTENKQTVTTSNPTNQIQQIDYSNDIADLKQRVDEAENKIKGLEERVTALEISNEEKDKTIASLKSKNSTLQTNLNQKTNQVNNLNNKVDTLRNDIDELQNTQKPEQEELKTKTLLINVRSSLGYEPNENIENPRQVTLRVTVNDEQVENRLVSEASTNENISITGRGSITIKVYINGSLKRAEIIDFNLDQENYEIK